MQYCVEVYVNMYKSGEIEHATITRCRDVVLWDKEVGMSNEMRQ